MSKHGVQEIDVINLQDVDHLIAQIFILLRDVGYMFTIFLKIQSLLSHHLGLLMENLPSPLTGLLKFQKYLIHFQGLLHLILVHLDNLLFQVVQVIILNQALILTLRVCIQPGVAHYTFNGEGFINMQWIHMKSWNSFDQ